MIHNKIALLVEVSYTSGIQYFAASSATNIHYSGQIWRALPIPISIAPVTTTETGEATGQRINFGGLTSSLIAQAMLEKIRGVPTKVWVAYLDDNDQVTSVKRIVGGKSDAASLVMGDDSKVSLTVQSRSAWWNRSKGGRFTDEEQQSLFPLDKFFEFVGIETSAVWPAKTFFER